jgi:hypothetical protein
VPDWRRADLGRSALSLNMQINAGLVRHFLNDAGYRGANRFHDPFGPVNGRMPANATGGVDHTFCGSSYKGIHRRQTSNSTGGCKPGRGKNGFNTSNRATGRFFPLSHLALRIAELDVIIVLRPERLLKQNLAQEQREQPKITQLSVWRCPFRFEPQHRLTTLYGRRNPGGSKFVGSLKREGLALAWLSQQRWR